MRREREANIAEIAARHADPTHHDSLRPSRNTTYHAS